jgi:hypothetical protein
MSAQPETKPIKITGEKLNNKRSLVFRNPNHAIRKERAIIDRLNLVPSHALLQVTSGAL